MSMFLHAQAIPEIQVQQVADGKIAGKVTDSKTKLPVDFATVALINNADSQTVKVSQTDLQGNFKLESIAYGNYTLKISFVGYQPFAKDTLQISAEQREIDLGTILLIPGKTNVLKEVVVQAERNAIQLGIDRKIFSVDQSLVSQGGSATDLLANVPTLSVDMDGNVSLRGTDNVRVLIDGKPSAIGGGNIAQVLQSLPASAIETIELITNPSSKYDAEGQSGIINIVLKKNKKIGLNGSVSVSAGSYDNYNASTNLSFRNDKVNLYGNYNYRSGNRIGGGFNNTRFFSGNGLVDNSTESKRTNLNNSFKIGGDYYINPKTTIALSGDFDFRNNKNNEDLSYLYQNIPDQNGSSFRTTDRNEEDTGYDLSLDFNRDFKRKGENLVANISFGQDKEAGIQNFNQNFFNSDGVPRDTVDRRINNSGEFSTSYNFQLDYTLPIKENQKVEAGFRSSIRNNDETQISDYYNQGSGMHIRDYNLSNNFQMKDIVHAVYTNYQNQLTDKFGVQVGLRAEQANLNTIYQGVDATTLSLNSKEGKLDYFRIYPSIFFTQKLSDEQQLQLSYTRRVNRPRGWQVNPFRDISDPNNIRVGNPGLKPEDIHSFEFSYINYWKSITLTSSIYYRQVNDVVEGIRQRTTDNNAATITQFFNLSRSRATGFELISKADITKGFSLTGNANFFYNRFDGNEEFNIGSSNGFNWNANLTGIFQFPKNISAQFNVNYMAPRVGAQGRSREMYGMDAGLRMEVLKNRVGSISLNARDIFNSRKWGQTTETFDFIQDSERRMQGRMFNLTFSYRFGKQDIDQKNREEQEPMEDEQF